MIAAEETTTDEILSALGLAPPKAIIIVIGGADTIDGTLTNRLLQVFGRGVARAAAEAGAILIDGGTKAGVMDLLGQGVAGRGQATPLVGVAPASLVTYPGGPPDGSIPGGAALEPNHSHFVLVPGTTWGSETDTLFKLAEALNGKAAGAPQPQRESKLTLAQALVLKLAKQLNLKLIEAPKPEPAGTPTGEAPILTILVNGGDVARDEALASVRRRWPVIVIEGSGGLADEVAALRRQAPDTRPAIADARVAEIVDDGNLYLFSPTGPADGLVRLIARCLRPGNQTLELAWQRFALYDANAGRQQKIGHRLQKWILGLGLLATVLALVHAQLDAIRVASGLPVLSWPIPFTSLGLDMLAVVSFLIILVPILVSVLVTVSNRRKSAQKWILLRATAEAVKREIYRYRVGAIIPIVGPPAGTTRESALAQQVETAGRRVMRTEVNESALQPYTGPIPPKMYGAAAKDDGYSRLTPEQYIDLRIGDQLNYYRSKTNRLERELHALQWIIIIAGGVGTLLAAIGQQLWVALTAALVTTFTAYLEYQQVEKTLTKYNQVEMDLANVRAWWLALGPEEQATQANVELLVEHTETILETELTGWVQQMRDVLEKLQSRSDGTAPEGDGEDDADAGTGADGTLRRPASGTAGRTARGGRGNGATGGTVTARAAPSEIPVASPGPTLTPVSTDDPTPSPTLNPVSPSDANGPGRAVNPPPGDNGKG